jgi:tRNA(fMet)-specific endonuclease VapC
MNFVLDTNICSAHFRRPAGLAHRFFQHAGRLFLCTPVLAELYAGAYHAADPAPLLANIERLLEDVEVLPFDQKCAKIFGEVRGRHLREGISIPSVDLMIASVALAYDCALVTGKTSDFRHVPNLLLENWLTA